MMVKHRHVGLRFVALLGLLVTLAGCSAPSQFVLELGADGGVVDVPLQFVPDRGVVDVQLADAGDAAPPPDGQVVDVEHVDVVTADAADGGALDVSVVDVGLDAADVSDARPTVCRSLADCPPSAGGGIVECAEGMCRLSCLAGFGDCDGDIANGCETALAVNPAHCGRCDRRCVVGDRCLEGACFYADSGTLIVDVPAVDAAREDRPDVVDVPVVDTPPAPCRRNTDCTGGMVCAFHGGDAGGTQVCEPPRGLQEGEACVLDRECQSGFCTDIGCARPCITTSDCAGATVRVDAGPLVCRPGASSTVLNCYQCPGCAS